MVSGTLGGNDELKRSAVVRPFKRTVGCALGIIGFDEGAPLDGQPGKKKIRDSPKHLQ